jgi:hypothetical protein
MKRFFLAFLLAVGLPYSVFAGGPVQVFRNRICGSGSPPTGGSLTTPDSESGLTKVHANVTTGIANGTYTVNLVGASAGSISFTVSGGVITSTNPVNVQTFTPYNISDNTVQTVSISNTQANYVSGMGTSVSWTNGNQSLDGPSFTCCTNGCSAPVTRIQTMEVTLTPPANTATWRGSIKANCPTQHALGLTINGVQVSYQVTNALASGGAPSTVSISYTCNSNTIDCADGKPWILSVDGAATQSGTISYGGTNPVYVLNVGGKGDIGNPVYFDCAPQSGKLALSGSLSVQPNSAAHSLSVKLNGTTVAVSGTSAAGLSTSQMMSLSTVVTANNGDTIAWYIDGVLQRQDVVAMTCGTTDVGYTCTDSKSYSGTASGNPPPTPTAPPVTPPPISSTPPPVTYTPPPAGTPPTNVTVGGVVGQVVVVGNPQDIYKPIVDALNGNGTAPPTIADAQVDPSFDTGAQPSPIANDQRGNLTTAINNAKNSFGNTKQAGWDKIASIQPLNLPTSGIGTKTSWGVTLPVLGAFTVDISPYQTWITLLRALLLIVMLIATWFITVKIIRSAIS